MEKQLVNQLQQAWEDVGEHVDILTQHSEHFAEVLRRAGEDTLASKFEMYFVNTLKAFSENGLMVTPSEIDDRVQDVVHQMLHPEE